MAGASFAAVTFLLSLAGGPLVAQQGEAEAIDLTDLKAKFEAVAENARQRRAEAIEDLVARYAAARESRDEAAIRRLFTADADQLVSSGTWRRGRQALVEGMLGSSRRNPGTRTLTVQSVRFPVPGLAVADARYVIRGTQGAEDRRMWSTFVCVRTPDGWRIDAIRNMLPAP